MTAGGDATIGVARSWVGTTENPPGSNIVPFWDWWGCYLGSWCGAFVSYCNGHSGYPLPAIDASCSGTATGFVLCSNGTLYTWQSGEIPPVAEQGDVLIFSWYAWELWDGIPVITDPEWYGWVAGDHTGYYVADLGDGWIQTIEGNTGSNSWDNGGAVLERTDRYWGQVCALWRPAIYGGPGSGGGGGTGPGAGGGGGGGGGSAAPPWPGVYFEDYTEHPEVATWQSQMAFRGWHLAVDGQYGPESARICTQFQAEKGLEVDGIVGPITWDAAWTAPIT
jgi:hypothetical protein